MKSGRRLIRAHRKITYGLKAATVYAEKVESKPEGSDFVLHVPNNAIEISLKMPGEFNVYNALAASAVAISLQIPVVQIQKGLSKTNNIAGRFESVDAGQPFSVIVDYAHAPEALESLLSLYRKLTKGRLFLVFGATGGGRDKSKRPKMGAIANEYADYIIVTDDDPYEEDEWEIIEQVSKGISRQIGKNFWQIPDRKEAIRLALMKAKENDTVIVAGKGCEEVIMLRGKRVPWNDKKVIEEILLQKLEIEL